MEVKNIIGTSDNTCKCDSWLAHWEEFSGDTASFCKVETCLKAAKVGAHVIKASGDDSSWYIVPMCESHNQDSNILDIYDDTKLVSANVANTCDKPLPISLRW